MSDFELDPMKDAINKAKHGLPLDLGSELFDGPFVEEQDDRQDYGETRFVATGPVASLADRVCVVVYTWRNAARRLISFRKANDEEIARYRATSAEPSVVPVTADRLAAARAWMTPERLAALDAMTDADIAAQIASNPDAAPELTDEWFENARLVIPLKSRKRAA